MMKSIEGGGRTGNRSAVRRKGGKEVPSADEVSDEGVEGACFRPVSSAVCVGLGVSVWAFAESGVMLWGGVGRALRRFPRAILEVVTPGCFAGRPR